MSGKAKKIIGGAVWVIVWGAMWIALMLKL